MGCYKSKAKVEEPTIVQRRDNQVIEREAEVVEEPKQIFEKTTVVEPPKITKAQHIKLVRTAEKCYENVLSLMAMMHENLAENEEQEDPRLTAIADGIKKKNMELQEMIPDLKLYPFEDSEEYFERAAFLNGFVKNLGQEFSTARKKTKKYPKFREYILLMMQNAYPDLFEFPTKKEPEQALPLPEYNDVTPEASPEKERQAARERQIEEQRRSAAAAEAHERELAVSLQKERDEVALALQAAVNEYNVLVENFTHLKHSDNALQQEYNVAQEEFLLLRQLIGNISYNNDILDLENKTLEAVRGKVFRNADVAEIYTQLQSDLQELYRRYNQSRANGEYMNPEKTAQGDYETQLLKRRYLETLQSLFANQSEMQGRESVRYAEYSRRSGSVGPLITEGDSKSFAEELEEAKKLGDVTLRDSTIDRNSLLAIPEDKPRNSVIRSYEPEKQQEEVISPLVEITRRIRAETDYKWVGAGLESKRIELQEVLNQEDNQTNNGMPRLSMLSGKVNFGLSSGFKKKPSYQYNYEPLREHTQRYSQNPQTYGQRQSIVENMQYRERPSNDYRYDKENVERNEAMRAWRANDGVYINTFAAV